MSFFRGKTVLFLVLLLSILFFTNDFGLIDIKKTALIVALAVDYEDGEYEVTGQIAIPQPTDQTAMSGQAVVSGKGDTISYAINEIGIKTGWFPKLSFCNLILFGKELLQRNIMDCVTYFLRTDRIPNTSELAVTDGKAKDFLLLSSPLDQLSSFSLQKVLRKDASKTATVLLSNIKDFSVDYYSKSGAGVMPLLKKVKSGQSESSSPSFAPSATSNIEPSIVSSNNSYIEPSIVSPEYPNSKCPKTSINDMFSLPTAASGGSGGAGSDSGAGGGSGGSGGSSGSSGSGGSGDEKYIFDASTTLLFSKGIYVGELNEVQTLIFNLMTKEVDDAVYEIDDYEADGQKRNVLLNIQKNYHKTSFSIVGGAPIFTPFLRLNVKLKDTDTPQSLHELAENYIVSKPILDKATKNLENDILEMFSHLRLTKADIFDFKGELYRYCYNRYDEFKDNVLLSTAIRPQIYFVSYK